MAMLIVLLLLFGLVFLLLAAVGVPSARVNFGWLGLACWLAAELLPRFH